MAIVFGDRVQETSTANSTPYYFALSGAVTGYQTFSSGIGGGNVTYYAATDGSGNWEVGQGVYYATSSGSYPANSLSRVLAYVSNAGTSTYATFSGSVTVFCTYPADNTVTTNYYPGNASPQIIIPNGGVLQIVNGGTGGTSVSTAQASLQVDPAGTAYFTAFMMG